MLNDELLRLVNSRAAWAFLGAGASAAAGLPAWRELGNAVLKRIEPAIAGEIQSTTAFTAALKQSNLPRAFGVIENLASRSTLTDALRAALAGYRDPGSVYQKLASWPFGGYITTNYDPLLVQALSTAGAPEYVPLGNARESLSQLSGDPTGVVWHLHGSLASPDELVVTEADYDRIYADGSPVVEALRAILIQRKVAFIGVSFDDPEISRLVRHLRLLLSEAEGRRSLVVCDADAAGRFEQERRLVLGVIKYPNPDGSHRYLSTLLDTHAALIVPRHVGARAAAIAAVPWDPMAANLLLYNELCLKRHTAGTVVDTLIRALLLATLREQGALLEDDLRVAAQIQARDLTERDKDLQLPVRSALKGLEEAGFVAVELVDEGAKFALTQTGIDLVSAQQGRARLLERQFQSSVASRLRAETTTIPIDADVLAARLQAFLAGALRKFAIPVAFSLSGAGGDEGQSVSVHRLMTELPRSVAEVEGEEQAALLRVAFNVLTSPGQVERAFLALSLQAQFGLQLLGIGEELVEARVAAFAGATFVADSSFLIAVLARDAPGHTAALEVVKAVRAIGGVMRTTPALLRELVGHANWAVGRAGSGQSPELLAYLRGYDEGATNLFLLGYSSSMEVGASGRTFQEYLGDCFGLSKSLDGTVDGTVARRALERVGITVATIENATRLRELAETSVDHIREIRMSRGTYRHERQVLAEAEVVSLVEHPELMEGSEAGASLLFVTESRVLDAATGQRAISIAPSAILQWVATLRPGESAAGEAVADALIGTLAQSGMVLISDQTLNARFSPLVDGSAEDRDRLLRDHRELMVELLGATAVDELEKAEGVQLPEAIGRVSGVVDALVAQLERSTRDVAERDRKIAQLEKLQRELAGYRAKQLARKEKGKRRQRRDRSRRKK